MEQEFGGRTSAMQAGVTAVVAIPVRNEGQRIAGCLQALAGQIGLVPHSLGILLFLNNCTDDTATVVAATIGDVAWPVRVVQVQDPQATAGWARRGAMNAAAAWLSEGWRGEQRQTDGLLLTTDADSAVGCDWVARNLACIEAGADAVAGRVTLDVSDAALLPASLHARGRLEGEYEALLTEIGARLDPQPGNAWPCHWTCSGASLAVRLSTYRAIGGMPALTNGEDRAFVDAVVAAGFVVRQCPGITVVTSGRLDGRASGGAADTMRLRCEQPDHPCDDRLERLDRAVRRVLVRRALRRAFASGVVQGDALRGPLRLWLGALSIHPGEASHASFALAHAAIEAASPALHYRALRPSQLPTQIRLARLLVSWLRRVPSEGRRDDTGPFETGVEVARTRLRLP